jgi:hypothetical protein
MAEGRIDTLTASAEMSGWPTPTANDLQTAGWDAIQRELIRRPTPDVTAKAAHLAGGPTPAHRDYRHANATTYAERGGGAKGEQLNNAAVHLAGWATPTANQANGTPEAFLERKRKSMMRGSQSMGVCLSDLNMQVQAWAGWPTPMAGTPAQNGNNAAGNNDSSRKTVWRVENGPARITADGQMLTGSSAGMESGGQLNPSFSRWLMGYPRSWDLCAQAVLKQRKRK